MIPTSIPNEMHIFNPLLVAVKNTATMRTFVFFLGAFILFSCTTEEKNSAKGKPFYPKEETLFKVVEHADSTTYFFFPNDSVVLKYELRTWNYTSPQGESKRGADFHANRVFLKQEEGYMDLSYGKRKSKTYIELLEKDSRYQLSLEDARTRYKLEYTVDKVSDYADLPRDPRKSWMNYYRRFYTDTLERFVPGDTTHQLIAFSRGSDIDTVHLSPYAGEVEMMRSTDRDTFLIDLDSKRLYAIPASYLTGKQEVISEKGSFDVQLMLDEKARILKQLKQQSKTKKDPDQPE